MENVTYEQTVTISWNLPTGVRPQVDLRKLGRMIEDSFPTAEITWEELRSTENTQEARRTEEAKSLPDPNEALLDVLEVVESGVNFGIKALKQALKR